MIFKEIYFIGMEEEKIRGIISKQDSEPILLQEVCQPSTEYIFGIAIPKDKKTFIFRVFDDENREIEYQQLKRGIINIEHFPKELL